MIYIYIYIMYTYILQNINVCVHTYIHTRPCIHAHGNKYLNGEYNLTGTSFALFARIQ